MLGKAVVSEVSLERDPHRTWLWLGPVEQGVELRRVQQLRGVDLEEWPRTDDEDPRVVERQTFADLEEALRELTSKGVDTEAFDAVWKSQTRSSAHPTIGRSGRSEKRPEKRLWNPGEASPLDIS